MSDPVAVIVLIVVAIFVLSIAFYCLAALLAGIGAMFEWSFEGGVVGTLIMLALWIFAFPVMAILAVLLGIPIVRKETKEKEDPTPSHPQPGDRDYSDWANREGKYSSGPRWRRH